MKVLNKTTPDLSIVKRLGGSGGAKVRHLFGLCRDFEKNREQVTVPHCLINSEQFANNSRTIRVQKQENVSPLIPINCPINRSVKETKRQREEETKRGRDKEKRGRDKERK